MHLLVSLIIILSQLNFAQPSKPVINALTQLSTTLLQVDFSYEGPNAKLDVINCRHYRGPFGRNHEFSIREAVTLDFIPGRNLYTAFIVNAYPGNACVQICARSIVCSDFEYLSMLTFTDDIRSLIQVDQKEIPTHWPYIHTIDRLGLDYYTRYRVKFTLKYDNNFYHSTYYIYTCRFTHEPFTVNHCRWVHYATLDVKYSEHEITMAGTGLPGGQYVAFLCVQDPNGFCSPPYFYETEILRNGKLIFPYITRVAKINKFVHSSSLYVEWFYSKIDTVHFMQVDAGHCVNGNIMGSVSDHFEGHANARQKHYSRVFHNLPKGFNCIQACDGKVGYGRCSRPVIFINDDEQYSDKQGHPKILRAVKKSRFGYSNEVEIFYGIPPSLFEASPVIHIYRCQFNENPFRAYNFSWVNWKILRNGGPGHSFIVQNMPTGAACVIVCGQKDTAEQCSLPYKIDNYIKTRTMMTSKDSPRVVSMKKFTKFAYSNNVNLTWFYPKHLIDHHPIMHIYTCQYSGPSSTFNYTLAVRLNADKNRENYKLEIYNLPTGKVCFVICGDSKTSEMCGLIFKFENIVDVNLKNFPTGSPEIIGMKRKVKYGYTNSIDLRIKFPPKTQEIYPYMVVYRCEYTYYPYYQTSNYTIGKRVRSQKHIEEYYVTVEGMPIGLACIHICAENDYFEKCGLPYRVKNTRKVEEKDYTENRPRIIHVAKVHEKGYSSMASVRYSYPSKLKAKFDAISIYRCRYYENPFRTFDYSLAMELRASGDNKIHSTQIDDLPRGRACIQICAMNEHFESCGLPYKLVN